jgi:hypothetical protein
VEASHRSIHPNIAGVPWWTALLIAVTATAIGYGIDTGMGHKDLTNIFAGLYIAGCVIAVLIVRQSGVFTAVIQPPLILFCAVPGAYLMFHGGKIGKLKDLLINCGYPLIERFPLMVGTAGGVLLLGVVRWYLGSGHQTATPRKAAVDDAAAPASKSDSSALGGLVSKLTGLLHRDHDDEAEEDQAPAKRGRAAGHSPRTARPARGGRTGQRSARTHTRQARPAPDDDYDPAPERPRRPKRQPEARDYEPADPPRRSRRPRPPGEPDPRAQQRREPYGRRNPYERPERPGGARNGRSYEGYEPGGPSENFRPPYERPESPERPHDSYDQPRRRPRPTPNGDSTHHPISQVRYRGSVPREETRTERRDEPHAERRGRSRANGRPQSRHQAENWEYDV